MEGRGRKEEEMGEGRRGEGGEKESSIVKCHLYNIVTARETNCLNLLPNFLTPPASLIPSSLSKVGNDELISPRINWKEL